MPRTRRSFAVRLAAVLGRAALFLAVLLFFASLWYIRRFGETGFDSILFTLLFSLEGAEPGVFRSFFLEAVLPGLAACAALGALLRGDARSRIDLVSLRSGRRRRAWPFPERFLALAPASAFPACTARRQPSMPRRAASTSPSSMR